MFEYTILDKQLIIKKDGVVVWKGEPCGCSAASVWVRVDLENGRILERVFTK
jgi:hypothetical protein